MECGSAVSYNVRSYAQNVYQYHATMHAQLVSLFIINQMIVFDPDHRNAVPMVRCSRIAYAIDRNAKRIWKFGNLH